MSSIRFLDFGDTEEIQRSLLQINLSSLLLVILLNIFISYVYAFRWFILIDARIADLNQTLRKYFFANYLNFFTPANLGGDIYKASAFVRENLSISQLAILLVFERAFSAVIFVILLALALVYMGAEPLSKKINARFLNEQELWLLTMTLPLFAMMIVFLRPMIVRNGALFWNWWSQLKNSFFGKASIRILFAFFSSRYRVGIWLCYNCGFFRC